MGTTWTKAVDEQGVAWLRFDLPGEKVNKFTAQSLRQLDEALTEVGSDSSVKALVIISGKADSFIVGADINELAAIRDAADAQEKSLAGQGVFEKLDRLKVPTVAVIHGACMGGGTEMALACDYRLATDHPKTSIALPEVNLGILPGWGGTQRLPRLVGLGQSLTMMMTGKALNGRKATKIGLADGLVAEAFLQEQTQRFLGRVMSSKGRKKVRRARLRSRPVWMRLLEKFPPTRQLIFKQAGKQALKRTKGHYPAPMEVLEVVRRSFGCSRAKGLVAEAEAFSRLAPSPVSQNLVWLFQASQRTKKTYPVPEDRTLPPVRHAGVVGAGVMGGGIAWALGHKGLTVRMKDIAWEAVAKGTATAAKMNRELVKRRKLTEGQMNLAMHRIVGCLGYEGFTGLDVVVEAVVEDMGIKKTVLAQIEEHVQPDALICTNTSSLSISEMGSVLKQPERFVGLHFFNPVNRMPLVEVIPGERTSPDTVLAAVALARSLGKTAVVVRDKAGFLVNRILLPYVNESVRMFEEGVDPERIDRLIEGFGMPMGPLTLADEVGLDVGLKVAKVLEDAFGPRMKVAELLGEVVRSGSLLGKKTGRGFYLWNKGQKKPNPAALALVDKTQGPGGAGDLTDDQVVDRAILTMVNEAARCLEERIVDDAETLDMAMLMGTGFAPFRGGLLRWADQQGPAQLVDRLNALAGEFGDRFTPAPMLTRLAEQGARFYRSADKPQPDEVPGQPLSESPDQLPADSSSEPPAEPKSEDSPSESWKA